MLHIMRIFIALDLTPKAKLKVANWRDRSFRDLAVGGTARPVPAGNFHITLAFVGAVAEYKLESLCNSVEEFVDRESIELGEITFDETGFRPWRCNCTRSWPWNGQKPCN